MSRSLVISKSIPAKGLGQVCVFCHVMDQTNLDDPSLVFAWIGCLRDSLSKWFGMLKEMN